MLAGQSSQLSQLDQKAAELSFVPLASSGGVEVLPAISPFTTAADSDFSCRTALPGVRWCYSAACLAAWLVWLLRTLLLTLPPPPQSTRWAWPDCGFAAGV